MDPSAWHTICGTPHYIAPEIISTAVKNKANYSLPSAIDIWGAGITLHCLLTGTLPFDDPNEARLFDKIVEGKLDLVRAAQGICECPSLGSSTIIAPVIRSDSA